MDNLRYAVILAGGRGERFWPVGRVARPKQFVDLFGGKPLIRHAAERLAGVVPAGNLFVVTSRDLVGATREALPELPPGQIVGEPFGRDTAAACALATELVAHHAETDSAALAILTADQLMTDLGAFRATLADGLDRASSEPCIVTIGIEPTYPATGFGYIEAGETQASGLRGTVFHRVVRFVEKPDAATAAAYLAGGRHLWNSGMFLWSVHTFREALRRFQPVLADGFAMLAPAIGAPDFDARLEAFYGTLGKISVDYAIMEKADNIVMARGTFAWDDVGSLTALPAHFPADAAGNVAIGRAALRDAERNVVVSREDGHLVAVFGASDLVVVHTPDATLVCPRARAAELKALVQQIAAQPGGETFL
jgi:mannose-1-phosphate guanylyltransferase